MKVILDNLPGFLAMTFILFALATILFDLLKGKR